MQISNLQIENKKNEYIDFLLKKSIVPTNLIVSKYIKEEYENGMLGIPEFKPFEIKKYETSNEKKWNKNFKNLSNDLNVLYQSVNILNNDIISCEELYLNEKERLMDKILNIELMIKNLRENLKSDNNLYSYVQTFNNFYACELNGNVERNIPYTTSFIDLIHKNVKNQKYNTINNKINISDATISLNSNIAASTKIGELDSILNDTINDFYFVEYSRSNDSTSFSIDISVKLKYPKLINTIILECLSPCEYTASLKVSSDNTNYDYVYEITSNNALEWTFNSQDVSSFKINIYKKTSDSNVDGVNYYYYIIKNISCLYEEYKESSTFVSNEIEIPSIINNVTLYADEFIFPETSISYFLGIDNRKDPIEWRKIKNNTELELRLFNTRGKILNNSLPEYGTQLDDMCSVIFNLPKGYSLNDIELYYGYQMWKLETLDIPASNRLYEYEPNINDYTDYYILRNSLIDTEEYTFSIRNAKAHYLTQYVYCDEEHYVRNKEFICTNNTGVEFKHKMYVNNYELTSIDNKYNFTLKKGLNVIHVILYIQAANSNEFSTIKHNINMKEYSFDVFASKKMKYINPKSLSSNSFGFNQNYYSVKNDKLIVKDNMELINEHIRFPNLLVDINYKNHSRYFLKYKQLNEYKKNLIFEDDNKTILRLMAILKSNNKSYSPQINSFRIISR